MLKYIQHAADLAAMKLMSDNHGFGTDQIDSSTQRPTAKFLNPIDRMPDSEEITLWELGGEG